MARNFQIERDGIIQRWYGSNPQPKNPRPHRSWAENPIKPTDCFGIPTPVNAPFDLWGHCMIWKYSLNQDGYGVLTIDNKQELAHRATYIQTRGSIPEEKQVNHLCNRPFCVQPAHLYAGTRQDNKDDAQIFNKHELLHAPSVIHRTERIENDNPMLKRLQESYRYDEIERWEPVEQPSQKPLEEFTCPRHDFAITMSSGNAKICRICETSEFEERTFDDFGTPFLISEICPASQTVTSILEKALRSQFVEETHRENRYRTYLRSHFGRGSHDLRSCGCEYCTQNRRTFRQAIQPLLTREESEVLDVCDRLEPQITAILEAASIKTMETWSRPAGLNSEQTKTLLDHYLECSNSRTEMVQATRNLERIIGYFTYVLATFESADEFIEDPGFEQIKFHLRSMRVREEDKEPTMNLFPIATEAADELMEKINQETAKLRDKQPKEETDLTQFVENIMWITIVKLTIEHLRYELTGRNNSTEAFPHPHQYCLNEIIRTGKLRPFPEDFEEGTGYHPTRE